MTIPQAVHRPPNRGNSKGLSRTIMVAAADRRITEAGLPPRTAKKLFPIPHLNGAVSYFGLADFYEDGARKAGRKKLSDWLPTFIQKHGSEKCPDLETFCKDLHQGLGNFFPRSVLRNRISGFHICGYNKDYIPEYWFMSNIDKDATPKENYKAAAPVFLKEDVLEYGWDGIDPTSCRNFGRIYRNGDFRGHVAASSHIDEIFKTLAPFPDFRNPYTPEDYSKYVEFNFEFIAYLYRKWAKSQIIGTPIDVMVWDADVSKKSITPYHSASMR